MKYRDVFISYKSEEFREAEWVRTLLENEGISCWMAPMCIPGGSNYAQVIPQAIRECTVFVLILSEKAQESLWVPRELDQAINAGKEIMPFVIENCALNDAFGFYLANVQRYDAFLDKAGVLNQMISDIKKIVQKKLPEMNPTPKQYPVQKKWNLNEGMCFDRGYISDYMVTNEQTGEAVIDYPFVLIVDQVIYDSYDIEPVLQLIEQLDAKLFIIAEDFGETAVNAMLTKKFNSRMEIVAVKAPSYGERRKEILHDIAILTGGKIISEESELRNVTMNSLGCVECIVVRKDMSLIIGGMGDAQKVADRIEQIRKAMKKTHSSFDKEKMLERIENLSKGMAGGGANRITNSEAVTMKYPNGTYVGMMKKGVPHGKGKMEYISGEVYEGDWLEGEIHGRGVFTFLDGEIHEGEFRNNCIYGQGIRKYTDGSNYEGNWEDGKKSGHGVQHSKEGNVFNGEWRDDQFIAGKAFIKYEDGSVYEGNWKDNQQNGKGIYYAANGNIFDGEWRNHQFLSGNCVLKYRDGRSYSGGFRDGNYNGKGTLKMPDGSGYEGDWVNGIRCGEGKSWWSDGGVYEGHWENDIANGYGVRSRGNIRYEGQWKDGKRHGHGTFTYSQGDKHECEWVNGEPWGYGTYTYKDGSSCTGYFKKDVLWSGVGTIKYQNGEVYTGKVENGMRHGDGLLIMENGTQIRGSFEKGEPHGKAVYTDEEGKQFNCKYNHGKIVPFSMKKI